MYEPKVACIRDLDLEDSTSELFFMADILAGPFSFFVMARRLVILFSRMYLASGQLLILY
jgi:hypothetical protein